MNASVKPIPWWMLLSLLPLAGVTFGYFVAEPDGLWTKLRWLAGAASLGLISGFTTGASAQTGAAAELLKFISGGILVPLVGGGMVALLQYRQGSKEHYEYYPAGQVKDKLIDVTVPEAFKYFHPLWVLGLFFVGYSAFAMVGVLLGLELRRVGFEIKVSR